jgi:hypothetical protein
VAVCTVSGVPISDGSLRERRRIHIPKRDTGARGEETFGNGAANATRTPGDDGVTIIEVDLIHVSDFGF